MLPDSMHFHKDSAGISLFSPLSPVQSYSTKYLNEIASESFLIFYHPTYFHSSLPVLPLVRPSRREITVLIASA